MTELCAENGLIRHLDSRVTPASYILDDPLQRADPTTDDEKADKRCEPGCSDSHNSECGHNETTNLSTALLGKAEVVEQDQMTAHVANAYGKGRSREGTSFRDDGRKALGLSSGDLLA